MPTTGRICRRDGEPPCYIEFQGVRVELGATELRSILRGALMDVRDASGPTQRVLREPLQVLSDLCDIAISLQRPSTDEDKQQCLKRFHESGQGGDTDIEALQKLRMEWGEMFRGNGNLEKHREYQQQYGDDISISE
jgi:hypothetical protein